MIVVGESVHFVSPGLYSARTPHGHGVVFLTFGGRHAPVVVLLNNGSEFVRFAALTGQAVAAQVEAEAGRLKDERPGVAWLPAQAMSEREWIGVLELAQSDLLKPPPPPATESLRLPTFIEGESNG